MTHPDDIDLSQQTFDPLGPVVHSATLATGRTVNYIDDGEPTWQPLLFFGGRAPRSAPSGCSSSRARRASSCGSVWCR